MGGIELPHKSRVGGSGSNVACETALRTSSKWSPVSANALGGRTPSTLASAACAGGHSYEGRPLSLLFPNRRARLPCRRPFSAPHHWCHPVRGRLDRLFLPSQLVQRDLLCIRRSEPPKRCRLRATPESCPPAAAFAPLVCSRYVARAPFNTCPCPPSLLLAPPCSCASGPPRAANCGSGTGGISGRSFSLSGSPWRPSSGLMSSGSTSGNRSRSGSGGGTSNCGILGLQLHRLVCHSRQRCLRRQLGGRRRGRPVRAAGG